MYVYPPKITCHNQVMDSDADGVPSEFFDYFKVSAWLSLSVFYLFYFRRVSNSQLFVGAMHSRIPYM